MDIKREDLQSIEDRVSHYEIISPIFTHKGRGVVVTAKYVNQTLMVIGHSFVDAVRKMNHLLDTYEEANLP